MMTAQSPSNSTAIFAPILMLLVCGCDSKPKPGAAAQLAGTAGVYTPGSLAETPHFALSVHSSKQCTVEPHFRPSPGVVKLGVELTVTGRSTVEVPVNPFYALLTDERGQRFEPTLVGCTPQLQAARVTDGQSARGWVTFNIPDASRGLKFSYAPVLIGAGRQEVIFELDP